MEFLAGSLLTLMTMFIVGNWYRSSVSEKRLIPIKFSQAYKFELLRFSFPSPYTKVVNIVETQSFKHRDSGMLKIFLFEGRAYWIKDQALFSADFDGQSVDEKTTKRVDTISMNDVELKKIIFVIDQLTESEGKNDPWSSGN
jgi:hypothetical protein